MGSTPDAVVVGAGPNGLAAAITLAREGCAVQVLEAAATAGGGCRSSALTLPGYVHDVCSAVQPLAAASPFFRSLPLAEHGVELVQPDIPLAHPLHGDRAALLYRDLERTCGELDRDGPRYRRLFGPLVGDVDNILEAVHGPLRPARHPLSMSRFGVRAIWPATVLARTVFAGAPGRAIFAGMAAHSMLELDRPLSAAAALLLGTLGHSAGWPFVRGGSQALANGMVSCLRALGGEVLTGRRVATVGDLPAASVVLFDLTTPQILSIAGEGLSDGYRRGLRRFRFGPGVCKVDWALREPIPWAAAGCRRAGTVHLGGTLEEIVSSERSVWAGAHPERPFVLLAQPTLVDASRAPQGKHTAWAYCHVPSGSGVDMTARIEAQVERFAPGFRDVVEARSLITAQDMERYNPNYVGGDINGGVQDLGQLFTRPTWRPVPYRTSNPRYYICSSSTPPGGGVHGMCGYFAARAALRHLASIGRMHPRPGGSGSV